MYGVNVAPARSVISIDRSGFGPLFPLCFYLRGQKLQRYSTLRQLEGKAASTIVY
jgi:hypothetical protein